MCVDSFSPLLNLVYCCDTFALSVIFFLSQDILDLGLKWVLIAKVNGWVLCHPFTLQDILDFPVILLVFETLMF